MAYGVSTLSILHSLRLLGGGRLISIDPYVDWPNGKLVAHHQIRRAGAEDLHEHMCEPSYMALPKLLERGVQPDLVYIDGWHNFDYAFRDCFFADKLLRLGGVVAFNDAGWRSVFKVIRFLQRFRHYEEIAVGLPRRFAARNPVFAMAKRLEGRSTNDRYFRKLDSWEPPSGFHRNF